MKKILFLLLMSQNLFATNVLKIGSNGYVTIDGSNYKRGYLGSSYYLQGSDTLLQINVNSGSPRPFIYGQKSTQYLNGDAANAPFASMSALVTWMNSHFEPMLDTVGAPLVADSINAAFLARIDTDGSYSNNTTINSTALEQQYLDVKLTASLDSGKLWIGDTDNTPTQRYITGDFTINYLGAGALTATGVTAATYGSATQVSRIILNDAGQVTGASNITIKPAFSSITATPTTLAGYGITNAPTILSGVDLLAVTTATTVATYSVTATATYEVGGYIAITAIATDVIELRVTWTDENTTSQTQKFYPMGITTSGLSATGFTPFSPIYIRAKTGTNIVVATVLTTGTGSITYDVGERINLQ